MPNVPQLIRTVTRQKRVQQYIIEKDYALSYLLAAIVHTDGLGENLVLKGGTALKSSISPITASLKTWIIRPVCWDPSRKSIS